MSTASDVANAPVRENKPSISPYWYRGIILLVCTGLAFYDTFAQIFADAEDGAASYSLTALLMSVVLIAGLDRRHIRALNIHDREVDIIIGIMALVLAVSVKIELLPRFVLWDVLLRLDRCALLIFLFGACGLFYGMRATLYFWPGWLLLFLYGAPVFLITSVIFGGGWTGPAMATVIGLAFAIAVAADRKPLPSLVVGMVTFGLGAAITYAVASIVGPDVTPPMQTTQLPGVVATLIVVANKLQKNPRQWFFRRREPAVRSVKWATALVLIASVVMALGNLARSPAETPILNDGPQEVSSAGVATPAGWTVTDTTTYTWAPRYFGPGSSLQREMMTADSDNPQWDSEGRERTVAVDTLRAAEHYQARTFGNETLYSTVNGRQSDPVIVDLGHDVQAEVYTILDESDFLTYTKLTFAWTREDDVVENISVIAVDDHRPEAHFPALAPSLGRLLTQIVTILFRGNAVTIDSNTTFKDLDLVTDVGRGIVNAEEW